MGAAPSRSSSAPATLSSLPRPLLDAILADVRTDTRLRCREVCREWRDALDDPQLWRRVDLGGGGTTEHQLRVLRAAASRAGAQLAALDVSKCAHGCFSWWRPEHVPTPLWELLQHAPALRELRLCNAAPKCWNTARWDTVDAVLRAAPLLRVLELDVYADSVAQALRMLRNEPPYRALRMHRMLVPVTAADDGSAAGAAAFAAAVARHPTLDSLFLLLMHDEGPHAASNARSVAQLAEALRPSVTPQRLYIMPLRDSVSALPVDHPFQQALQHHPHRPRVWPDLCACVSTRHNDHAAAPLALRMPCARTLRRALCRVLRRLRPACLSCGHERAADTSVG